MSEEMETKDIIYLAYLVLRLSEWKYEVYSSHKIEDEIKLKAPMNYNPDRLFVNTLKKLKPELYDRNLSLNEIISNVEIYFFGKVR